MKRKKAIEKRNILNLFSLKNKQILLVKIRLKYYFIANCNVPNFE